MQPRKTDLARTALQAHRAPLDMRQRRLLILCDGQRDLAQLTAMIGPEAASMVIQLIQGGYLHSTAPAEPPPRLVAAAVHATASAAAGTAGTASAASAASAAPSVPTERRRSLVAARIYLLGILELQRHPHAAALLLLVQQARSDEAVIGSLRTALEALPALTSVGYAERVRGRLLEVLPKEQAAGFQASVV